MNEYSFIIGKTINFFRTNSKVLTIVFHTEFDNTVKLRLKSVRDIIITDPKTGEKFYKDYNKLSEFFEKTVVDYETNGCYLSLIFDNGVINIKIKNLNLQIEKD